MQILVRLGHVRFAGGFAILLIWMTMTYQAYQADGLWDAALLSHLAIIILAALMIGWREGIVVGIGSLIVIWYFAYQQNLGLREFNVDIPFRYARDLTAVFVITSILVYYLVYHMNRSLIESQVELRERLRAEEKLQLQAQYLTALHETTLGLVNRLELNPLLKSILDHVSELLDTPDIAIDFLLPDESALKQELGKGIYADMNGTLTHKGDGVTGKVWEEEKTILTQNYHEYQHKHPNAADIGYGSVLGVPIKSQLKVAGVLLVVHKENQKKFTQENIILLERLA
ncbi:MAG: GAF domain-containing protein, partial [Anaerolineales bacterium]|nr:GAF domain-containing protein [Anaerolineales bacterium]